MEWVVNATRRPLYPRERPVTHCIGGWVGLRAGLAGAENISPAGIRFPDRPACSESLYRLRYPDSRNAAVPPKYKCRRADLHGSGTCLSGGSGDYTLNVPSSNRWDDIYLWFMWRGCNSSDNVASSSRMVNVWWIGKDVESGEPGLIGGTVLKFDWRDRGKLWELQDNRFRDETFRGAVHGTGALFAQMRLWDEWREHTKVAL